MTVPGVTTVHSPRLFVSVHFAVTSGAVEIDIGCVDPSTTDAQATQTLASASAAILAYIIDFYAAPVSEEDDEHGNGTQRVMRVRVIFLMASKQTHPKPGIRCMAWIGPPWFYPTAFAQDHPHFYGW